jgi:membrane fusion protein, multidrug efflux system
MDSGPGQFGHATRGGTLEVSRVQTLILLLIALDLPGCNANGPQPQDVAGKLTVAVVQSKSATIKHSYRCRIESHRYLEVRTEADGQLAAILVKEGQAVKQGDLLFQVGPPADKKKPGSENRGKAVSIKAPFDGLVGRLPLEQGSFVTKYETLTTLSDSSRMSVYFDMPEKHYLEYFGDKAERGADWRTPDLELNLADHSKYPHVGKIVAILGCFNNTTGDITFRAEFRNPDGLLRHGKTGTLLLIRLLQDAILISQHAMFEDHAKRYVYVVDNDHVAHQREIVIDVERPGTVKLAGLLRIESAGLQAQMDRVQPFPTLLPEPDVKSEIADLASEVRGRVSQRVFPA